MQLDEIVALMPRGQNECTLCGEHVVACRHLNDRYMILHKDITHWYVCHGVHAPNMEEGQHNIVDEEKCLSITGNWGTLSRVRDIGTSFEEALAFFKEQEEPFIEWASREEVEITA